jgi:hypothetical protein
MINKRNSRTPSSYIGYGLYMYFLDGLSYRNTSKALSYLYIVKSSYVAIWKWIQKYHPQKKILTKRKMISKYIIVDETPLKSGSFRINLVMMGCCY